MCNLKKFLSFLFLNVLLVPSVIAVPDNAKPNPYGAGWICNAGYRRVGDGCSKVEIPPNAKLNVYGNGWECSSGFKRVGEGCSKVEIPANAKLNVYGNGWECSRGFKIVSAGCVAMTAEEIKVMEAREQAIMATIAAKRASLASGNSCETESRSGAEVCLSISNLNFDCSKSAFGNYYNSCEASISYDLETNYKGRGYLDVEVDCRIEIEYNGKGFYSTRSDSQTKDESSSLYANGFDSETIRFDFSFSSFEEVHRAKIVSHRCEIDAVNLY